MLSDGPERLPFPLEERGCSVMPSRRAAWVAAFEALALPAGAGVLTPEDAGEELCAALAGAGLERVAYVTGPGAAPETHDDLVTGGVGAIVVGHPVGFPEDGAAWRAWCSGRGLALIEDVETAWLSRRAGRPTGHAADVAVFSLAPALGVAGGAALLVRDGLGTPPASALEPPGAHERLTRHAGPHVAARRRAHYAWLLEAVPDAVEPSYGELSAGDSPWVFPVRADDDRVRRLEAAGIESVEVPSPGDRPAVGVPVHQDLRLRDLRRIAGAVGAVGAAPPMLEIERFDSLGAARPLWTELAPQTRNVFSTWEFADAWWRHFGDGLRPLIACVRSHDGRPLGILPLCEMSVGGVRIVRAIGYGVADELGPVCAPEDRPAVARGLLELLSARRPSWHVFIGDRFSADLGWDALLEGHIAKRESSPVLDLHGASWETVAASLSRNLRSKVGRTERRLQRERGLAYRLTTDVTTSDADVARLIALHEARWGTKSTAFDGARRAFHADFARVALEQGWLRLWSAELEGETAAAWLGYHYAGIESFYQLGRDPKLDNTSLGLVLLAHTIRAAADEGREEYRFLRGEEDYKKRFATRDSPVDTLVRAKPSFAGAMLRAARAVRGTARGKRMLRRFV